MIVRVSGCMKSAVAIAGRADLFVSGMPAPHAGTIDVVAALVAAPGCHAAACPRQQQSLDRPRFIDPVQEAAGIPSTLAASAQNPAVAGVAQQAEQRPIDHRTPHRWLQFATPGGLVVRSLQQAARSQHARQDRVAHAEAPQKVLKACLLSCDRVQSAARTGRDVEVAHTTVGDGVDHVQARQSLECGHGAPHVLVLTLETGEHAALDGSAPPHDEQVRVALRCQFIVENRPEPVAERGLEVIANGDRVRRLGTGCQDSRTIHPIQPAVEPHLDTQRLRLLQERRVQCPRSGPALHHVEERPAARDLVALAPGVEDVAAAEGQGGEVPGDAQVPQPVEHVVRAAPVLQTLKVATEAMPDFALQFMHAHAAACPGQGDRSRKSRRTGAADLDEVGGHQQRLDDLLSARQSLLAAAARMVRLRGTAGVLVRIGDERLVAGAGAEVVHLSAVLGLGRRLLGLHLHLAYRIDCHLPSPCQHGLPQVLCCFDPEGNPFGACTVDAGAARHSALPQRRLKKL